MMAPEVHSGAGHKLSSDVYLFGSLVFEVLAEGQMPWEAELSDNEDFDFKGAIINGQLPSRKPMVIEQCPIIAGLLQLMEQCTQLKPDVRPTMDQVVQQLQAITPFLDPAHSKNNSNSDAAPTAATIPAPTLGSDASNVTSKRDFTEQHEEASRKKAKIE